MTKKLRYPDFASFVLKTWLVYVAERCSSMFRNWSIYSADFGSIVSTGEFMKNLNLGVLSFQWSGYQVNRFPPAYQLCLGDEGSPVFLAENSSPKCIFGVFNAHNQKCYHPNGRLIFAYLDHYQFKTFESKCDHAKATEQEKMQQKLIFDYFMDIETFSKTPGN